MSAWQMFRDYLHRVQNIFIGYVMLKANLYEGRLLLDLVSLKNEETHVKDIYPGELI